MATVLNLVDMAIVIWERFLSDNRVQMLLAVVMVAVALVMSGDAASAMPRARF